MSRLTDDLAAMVGVWHDRCVAQEPDGTPVTDDPHGGVPGPFPYENLVYFDFDGERTTQTNVTIAGRPVRVRTFCARLDDGVLRFDRLGPEAPEHVGVSGGPGVIWFVPQRWTDDGLARYSEPDMIRLDGDRRWRDTALWRHGELVRTMHVTGARVSTETSRLHRLDPRDAGESVHAARDVTRHFLSTTDTER